MLVEKKDTKELFALKSIRKVRVFCLNLTIILLNNDLKQQFNDKINKIKN